MQDGVRRCEGKDPSRRVAQGSTRRDASFNYAHARLKANTLLPRLVQMKSEIFYATQMKSEIQYATPFFGVIYTSRIGAGLSYQCCKNVRITIVHLDER
jgi:hypothetical protein